jgi:lipopolysaccharide export system protein LptC
MVSGRVVMLGSSKYLVLLIFLFLSFGCNYDRVRLEDMRGENLMLLNDVLIRDVENGEERMKIYSRSLEYNRDRSLLSLREGRIDTQVRAHKIEGDLNITFEEAVYNLIDGDILIERVGGISVDRNLRLEADRIWLNVKSGDMSVEKGVRVTGKNFDFLGDGFRGNFKDGVYSFEGGIMARIF